MQLEDFFEFETLNTPHGAVERIQIKGHRIPIEYVLARYKEGLTPETIVRDFYPTLSLEEIHATITFYLHERDRIDDYIQKGQAFDQAYDEEQLKKEPPDVVKRVRAAKAQQAAGQGLAPGTVTP